MALWLCYRSRAITKTTVHHVVSINGSALEVFYIDTYSWQFRVISPGGAVFNCKQ
ncbi:hypothetical protein GNF10_25370 [Nostoc sp. UCD121]|uniref:hypothetical protein n=1 Tax=unclassified Nostoc TaxID=2593658 RepID=UPI001624DE47|nr:MULTISPECIES: hypothetical protein [unclassified Nostoc]MBC1220955.1 hypothetical protein [Nostoc sp. UCD120]MBC1279201.1 hypothetical protein [Nostoc sp. UCD121]MBC1299261.1 hypothetical protein [Nostoc sp. UCD122]